jgi:hypothetical protein
LLVARAVDEARRRGIREIHYLSREGALLARMQPAVAAVLGIADPPRAVHLPVSRRSTFGPSLSGLEHDELLRLWTMYPNQTPRAFLVSLGLDPDSYVADAHRAGLPLDAVVEHVPTSAAFRSFLDLGGARMEAELAASRATARAHLGRMLGDGPEHVVVDLGWRGTIQDNLARTFADRHFTGVYLGLFRFLNPQPPNTAKIAVGPDENDGDDGSVLEPVSAIERVVTPPVPSAVGYRLGDEGETEVVLEDDGTAVPGRVLLDGVQEGILASAGPALARLRAAGIDHRDARDLVTLFLDRYLSRAPDGAADAYFAAAHDESFGVLNDASALHARPNPRWVLDHLLATGSPPAEDEYPTYFWRAGFLHAWPVRMARAGFER